MSIVDFFRNRVFVIVATSLAALVVYLVVVNLPQPELVKPPVSVARARAELTPPVPAEAIFEPQTAPRPPANADLATLFPSPQLPVVATAPVARISLACLAKNGANLSKPMPSKHCVYAANEQVAAQLRAWGQANGFEVRDEEVLHSHTGTKEYRFNLVRVEVPAPEKIESEGRLILSAVQSIPGTYYQTWCGEIVR
jgi:hypothetical protein